MRRFQLQFVAAPREPRRHSGRRVRQRTESVKILITSIVDLKRVTRNRIHVFADYLSRKHDVTVLCLNAWWLDKGEAGTHSDWPCGDPSFREMFARTRILYLGERRIPPVLQEFTCLRTLDSLLRTVQYASFDVHVNYSSLVAGYFVARKVRDRGIPTVFDVADDLPRRLGRSPQVPRFLRPPARLVADFMFDANVGLASEVTFVTEALKDAYHAHDGKGQVIPNGANPGIVASQRTHLLRRDLGIDDGFVVGFAGVLLPRVDLDTMFVAVKRASRKAGDVRMLVVGGGPGLREARQLAERHGISDRVVFTGLVPSGRVEEYISCMDACLIPIEDSADCQHALPLKLLEYMACEKPVISSRLAGVIETAGDRVLYASDSEELEDRILQLYHDRAFGNGLGLQGRSFVEQNYTWPMICARFEDVLTAVRHE